MQSAGLVGGEIGLVCGGPGQVQRPIGQGPAGQPARWRSARNSAPRPTACCSPQAGDARFQQLERLIVSTPRSINVQPRMAPSQDAVPAKYPPERAYPSQLDPDLEPDRAGPKEPLLDRAAHPVGPPKRQHFHANKAWRQMWLAIGLAVVGLVGVDLWRAPGQRQATALGHTQLGKGWAHNSTEKTVVLFGKPPLSNPQHAPDTTSALIEPWAGRSSPRLGRRQRKHPVLHQTRTP